VIVRNAKVVPGDGHEPYAADLGINFTVQEDRVPVERGGLIEDFGDLCVTSGKTEHSGGDLLWLPGRIAYSPEINPLSLPGKQQASELLSKGVTAVVGRLNLDSESEIEALAKINLSTPFPIHFGFVATCEDTFAPVIADRLPRIISLGVLGLVVKEAGKVQALLEWFKLPLLTESDLPSPSNLPDNLSDLAEQISRTAKLLGFGSRGAIKIGTPADLIAFAGTPNNLRRVMLGGRFVLDDGKILSEPSGVLLRR
jgi:hypothetical protein